MEIPQPVFIGFFPKATLRHPLPSVGNNVEEVCSVSSCLSQAPPAWVDHWRHNDLGFYDSERTARDEIPQDGKSYEIYAYKVYPLVFESGTVKPWAAPVMVKPDLSQYTFLGHDVVSKSVSDFFECSPLTCNLAANEFAANRYGLIDAMQDAYQAAITISKGGYEPGSYYLFEVYRWKA